MHNSGIRSVRHVAPPAAFYMGDRSLAACALPRELRVAAIIARAPRFSLEEIIDDLTLRTQGGLRGHVRDEELN